MRSVLSIICLIVICLVSVNSIAQDALITNNHDTLQVKILKITEKTVSYKLTTYEDGPTYELSNNRIGKIVYSNGEEYSFDNGNLQGAPIYDQYKNSVEFIASDLVLTRAGLAYSRFFGKSFEVRIEGSVSLVTHNYNQIGSFANFGGVQFNYHPLSFRRLDYYVGVRGRLGNTLDYRYEPYYYDNYEYFAPIYSNRIIGTVGVINGLRVNLNKRFAINTAFSLDIMMEEARGATQATAGGIFGLCYKF